MINLAYILAKETDEGFAGPLIGLVILAILGILSSILKHRQRKQQEAEMRRLRERSSMVHSASAPAGPPPTPQPASLSAYQQHRRPAPPPPLPPPTARSAREALAQAIRQQSLLEELAPLEPPGPEQTSVNQELLRQRQRQARLKKLQHKRLAAAQPAEADRAEIEKRLHVGRAPSDRVGGAPHFYRIDLSDHRRAMGAILAHEILSQPKALRRGPEMWDL